MDEETIRMDTGNGVELTGTFYDNENSSRGVILLPGITEHRSSLDALATTLHDELDARVWVFDLNGQGESGGTWKLAEMIESMHNATREIKKKYGIVDLGGHGNSTGAMALGIAQAQEAPIDALALSGAPAGLQDVVPRWTLKVGKYIPQWMVRSFSIGFDLLATIFSDNYRNKSHKQFCTDQGYASHAEFGATRIENMRDFIEGIETAPRLDAYVAEITAPTLFLYGGRDSVNKIRKSRLSPWIQNMYDATGSDKKLLIVDGADHCLNRKTKLDGCYNEDPNYSSVKDQIAEHFGRNMK